MITAFGSQLEGSAIVRALFLMKETINFDGDIDLTDSQGRTYETYSDALWYYDDTFSYTDLAPNIKQSGTLIYNVPTDSVDYYLTVAKAGTNDAYRLLGK